MKILFLGDLHLGARNGNPNFLRMMDEYFKEELFPYILENDVKVVVQLGDILDKRRNIDFTISNYLVNTFFKFFNENEVYLYSTLGNHDVYYRQSIQLDGPSQFANSDFIHIVKDCRVETFDKTKIAMTPWICDENKEEVTKWIVENKNRNTILCGHFELAGFPIQKGYISDKGTIDTENMKGYKCVLSGHYHSPSDKDKITYVGTPYELTWSDYGDEKKFIVYDTEEKVFETIYTKKKMFHKIVYTDDILQTINYDNYKKSYIKVVLSDDYNEGKLNVFLSMLDEKCQPFSIQTIDIREQQENLMEEISADDVDNPIEIMMNTIDSKVEDETLCQLVKSLTYEIYQSAMDTANV